MKKSYNPYTLRLTPENATNEKREKQKIKGMVNNLTTIIDTGYVSITNTWRNFDKKLGTNRLDEHLDTQLNFRQPSSPALSFDHPLGLLRLLWRGVRRCSGVERISLELSLPVFAAGQANSILHDRTVILFSKRHTTSTPRSG